MICVAQRQEAENRTRGGRTGSPAAQEALGAVGVAKVCGALLLEFLQGRARRRREARHEAWREDVVRYGAADEERHDVACVRHIQQQPVEILQDLHKALRRQHGAVGLGAPRMHSMRNRCPGAGGRSRRVEHVI